MINPDREAYFVISVVSKLVCMHPQTIRHYEDIGLVTPARTDGNIRLYSMNDVEKLKQIRRLTKDLGVNLAGVEVIINMLEKMEDIRQEKEREIENIRQYFEEEVRYLRKKMQEEVKNDEEEG